MIWCWTEPGLVEEVEGISGWELVPYPRDLRGPGVVGMDFGFSKRIRTEGAGLSAAGDFGDQGSRAGLFPC